MNNKSEENIVSRRGAITQMALAFVGMAGRPAAAQNSKSRPAKWDEKMELVVEFEILQADSRRYKRPYVAVWIEDKEGKEIRTLSLWVQNTGRGPRWIPDLKRWYKTGLDYFKAQNKDLILTASSATRNPGKYSLVWNGKDDKEKIVDQGVYQLYIEAAREHGTYQLMRKEITIGPKPFREELAGNVEIKGATIEFRKRK